MALGLGRGARGAHRRSRPVQPLPVQGYLKIQTRRRLTPKAASVARRARDLFNSKLRIDTAKGPPFIERVTASRELRPFRIFFRHFKRHATVNYKRREEIQNTNESSVLANGEKT